MSSLRVSGSVEGNRTSAAHSRRWFEASVRSPVRLQALEVVGVAEALSWFR
jgi:hypothetical protein